MPIGLEVRVWRGSILESRHRIEAAVADAHGRLVAGTADPALRTTFRSAAKPFQLLALIERGHAERWGFRDQEVAVMAASHTGSAYHRELVRGILGRIGLDERALACAHHAPLDPAALAEVRADPAKRSALHNNCSGKHAGMLALAVAEGWPVAGYERPEHPVQQAALRSVAELCGVEAGEIVTGTDDCGVVVFGLPLSAMATGYARLAVAPPNDARGRALDRIRAAMTTHPGAVGGAGRLSTALMEALGGRVISKGGAEGLECAGILAQGLGIAMKCVDGAGRGLGPAMIALFEHLDAVSEEEAGRLSEVSRPILRNHAGREVGRIEARLEAPKLERA